MAKESVDISIGLKTQKLMEGLSKLEGEGKAETAKMVKAMTAELAQLQKKVKTNNKETTDDFGKTFGKVSALGKEMASKLGGSTFGPIADTLTGLGEKFGALSETIGPVGVAVAGMAVAAAAGATVLYETGKAAFALADAAVAAEKHLTDLGLATMIPAQSRQSLDDYQKSQDRLGVAVDTLTVALGSELAPGLAEIIDTTTAAIQVGKEWIPVLEEADSWLRAISPMVWAYRGAQYALGEQIDETNVSFQNQIDKSKSLSDQLKMTTLDVEELRHAQMVALGIEESVADETDRIAKRKAASAAREKAALDDMLKTLSGVVAKDKQLLAIKTEDIKQTKEIATATNYWADATNKVALDAAQANAAIDDALKQSKKATEDYYIDLGVTAVTAMTDITDSLSDLLDQQAGFISDRIGNTQNRLHKLKDDNKKIRDQIKKTNNQALKDELQDEITKNKGKIQSTNDVFSAEIKALRKVFVLQKAADLSKIAASAAVATTAALKDGPIAAPIEIAAIAATSAIQAAIVARQKPPTAHTGKAPDEDYWKVKSNEAILSQRAANTLGRKAINNLNNGIPMSDSEMDSETIGKEIGKMLVAYLKQQNAGKGMVNPHNGKRF